MTALADEHERTMAYADIALGQLKALRQPAIPRNYEIWYAYATGYHPSLNQKINETLPDGMEANVVFDSARFIEQNVHHIEIELVLAVFLTALVCWMFLGSLSSTVNVLGSLLCRNAAK